MRIALKNIKVQRDPKPHSTFRHLVFRRLGKLAIQIGSSVHASNEGSLFLNSDERSRSGVSMRVLLIEDDAKLAKVLAKGLQEEGFVVDLATTETIKQKHPVFKRYDLMVLDWLVEKDGLAVCETLRARDAAQPILMISAHRSVADRVRGFDAGADDYLMKPFDLVELVARMRALLRRSTTSKSTVLRMTDLMLDPKNRRVTRAGVRIQLTSKEYKILELLMQNADEAVSRARFIESVWSDTSDVPNYLIVAHMSKLRKKIDHDSSSSLIQNVPGFGYRLSPPQSERI